MKKHFNRVICILISAVLVLTPMLSLGAAAVSYPTGITSADSAKAIPTANTLVKALLASNEQTEDLSSAVYSALFADKTMNKLFIGIYSQMQENESTFSGLGIDISVSAVASCLSAYPEISSSLAGCADWTAAFKTAENFKWGITDKNGFASAFTAMLAPFNSLLYTVLCAGSYKLNVLISVKGDEGYANAIIPVLEALGCSNIMSADTFKTQAKSNNASMVKNIVLMLCSVLDDIIANPVAEICNKLPSIAYFLENDGLSKALESLVGPLSIKVANIITLTGVSKLIENAGMLESSSSLTEMFNNISLKEITGDDMQLDLPEINLTEMAQCGSVTSGKFTVDSAAAFITVLRWGIEALKLNSDKLSALTGGDASADMSGIAGTLLSKSTDTLASLIIKLLNTDSSSADYQYQWTFPTVAQVSVQYTENRTQENYQKVLDGIDGVLNEVVAEYSDYETLGGILSEKIYSSSTLTTLAKSVYSALWTDDTASLFGALGYNFSPSAVASELSPKYSRAASSLSSVSSWSAVGESSVSWGFSAGSRDGFSAALTEVLKPLFPLLRVLLAGDSIKILNAIDIYGSNGYNTAAIPLLEALGCKTDSIVSYTDYKAQSTGDGVFTNVTTPIFDLLDTLMEKPVYTVISILPNLVYFFENGMLDTCIKNLIAPIAKLLDEMGMGDMLTSQLSSISNIDLEKTVSSLLSGSGLSLKLPALDIKQFAGMGTPESYTSRRTYNGAYSEAVYVKADGTAVLITLLRYLVDALKIEDNAGVLTSLMDTGTSSDAGAPDMFSTYASQITEQFAKMTTDETIEWLYNLLFRDSAKKEETVNNDFIPTIIYAPHKDYSGVKAAAIIIAVFAVLFGAVILSAKFGGQTDRKERRQREKLKKKRLKEESKQSIVTQNSPHTAASAGKGKKQEKQEYKQRKAKAKKDFDGNSSAYKDYIRQEKAARRAYKATKKADKYYERAVRDAASKR